MFKFRINADVNLIEKIFRTNFLKFFTSINLNNILWLIITAILPILLFTKYVKINFKPLTNEIIDRILYTVGSLCLIFVICLANYKNYSEIIKNNKNVIQLVNTLNYVHSTIKYLKNKYEKKPSHIVAIDNTVKYVGKHQHKTLLIFVQGKSARASNFSLGDYKENKTNPLLSKQNIIYYDKVESCSTNTHTSINCIFSHFNRNEFSLNKAKNYENILDLISKVGYDTIWIDNFGVNCEGVCNRIKTETVVKNQTSCFKKYCRDEILLDHLNKKIQNIDKNSVIILNTIGSSGLDYYKRYNSKFKKFTPTCDIDNISKCDKNSIINSYDNSILYTDWILSSIIDAVKNIQNISIAIIYTSDHGESLGESNIYFHNIPYSIAPKFQKQVPMIVYMNDLMKQEHKFSYDCLKGSSRKKSFSHNNIFHSLLGLLEIKSELYNEKLDIFKRCRIRN